MRRSNFNYNIYIKTLLDENRFIKLFIGLFYNGTELIYTLTTQWIFLTHRQDKKAPDFLTKVNIIYRKGLNVVIETH